MLVTLSNTRRPREPATLWNFIKVQAYLSALTVFFSGVGSGSVELRKRNSFQRMSATRERDTLDNTQVLYFVFIALVHGRYLVE